MKNKKGFTLIELLAVIIILGVLMIIAIPSVTAYILNSRKEAYAKTAISYVNAAKNLVNSGKLGFYDTDAIALIPVGYQDGTSCIQLETGGQSPFSDEWKYAFVLVEYRGNSYFYSAVMKDGAGNELANSSYNPGDTDSIISAENVKITNWFGTFEELYSDTSKTDVIYENATVPGEGYKTLSTNKNLYDLITGYYGKKRDIIYYSCRK